jgi:hypothetical protein
MALEEQFFTAPETMAAAFAGSTEQRRKKGPLVMRVPMLLAEESEPLRAILICRGPEERILIVKEFDQSRNRKR